MVVVVATALAMVVLAAVGALAAGVVICPAGERP